MKRKPKYKRILLKISGEALGGKNGSGIDPETLNQIIGEIKAALKAGVEMGIVVGGGNIFRGMAASRTGLDRVSGDYMGMLATVMNSLALQDRLEKEGIETRVLSAITMRRVAEPFIRRRAMRHIEKKRVIIMAAGTGNPYFTTDTAAALRAIEINADVIVKATKVDGVYSADPVKNKNAKRFDKISYLDVLKQRLAVMDSTAVSLCMENNLPIIVFKLLEKNNLKKLIMGEAVGTLVKGEK